MNNYPRKPSAPLADRVARALAQEARVERRLGNLNAADACGEAFLAVVMPPKRIKVAGLGRLSDRARVAMAVCAPVVSFAFLLLSGLSLV